MRSFLLPESYQLLCMFCLPIFDSLYEGSGCCPFICSLPLLAISMRCAFAMCSNGARKSYGFVTLETESALQRTVGSLGLQASSTDNQVRWHPFH